MSGIATPACKQGDNAILHSFFRWIIISVTSDSGGRAVNGQQLSLLLPTSSPTVVFSEVKKTFLFHYEPEHFQPVERHYSQVESLFDGRFPGYRRCNTEYHNFSHTVDTFLAVMRICDGFNLVEGPFPAATAAHLLSAALFHDTGYIQKAWDTLGTGAKYTREHVVRGKEFTAENAGRLGLSGEDLAEMTRYIDATGHTPALKSDSGAPLQERMAASLLGAADLIAQMSDRVYLEKLIFLYYEVREAEIPGYETEFDVIRKTVDFYHLTMQRLEQDFNGVHHYVTRHFQERFGLAKDLYQEAIDHNLTYVRKIMDDHHSNFRTKLKRVSL
jgi:hypothetical protein